MRIRKNAKICPLMYAASSLKSGNVLQTHICKLNQSPWDVMSFSSSSYPPPPPPPLSFKVNGTDNFARNGSLGEPNAAFHSNVAVAGAISTSFLIASKISLCKTLQMLAQKSSKVISIAIVSKYVRYQNSVIAPYNKAQIE
ncbi:Hypothetical predicted protein [Olea europaea subsp. europaea]|uniref:Uncharacterized protein n=1 Tax=Olea europaea subsp. europaea TaxID=158383 RepID=A0A8S0TA21_OLEEU|nr:Hypothetical predicted protein [Olea europaea subsp. europaea]